MRSWKQVGVGAMLALALAATPTWADGVVDSVVETLPVTTTPTKETLVALTALRGMRDPATAPLFDRLAASPDRKVAIYGMMASNYVTKDAAKLDVAAILKAGDSSTVGAALAGILDSGTISNDQLVQIVKPAIDEGHRVLAVSELSHRKDFADAAFVHAQLVELLASGKDTVRTYAAVTLLELGTAADIAPAMAALSDVAKRHDTASHLLQNLLLVRLGRDKVTAAAPWAATLAADNAGSPDVRIQAVATLLALDHRDGPGTFASLCTALPEPIQKSKLGLLAIEFAGKLKPEHVASLPDEGARSYAAIGRVAKKAVAGEDITANLNSLITEGQPFIMDWALLYSDRAQPARRMALRRTLLEMASTVDGIRGRDFDRAAAAAEKVAEDPSPEARTLMAAMLASPNMATTEAMLVGMVRSSRRDLADLVPADWAKWQAAKETQPAACYSAVILARENKPNATDWLGQIAQGKVVQSKAMRALAGWYYAKATGQTEALVKGLLASKS